MTQYSSWFRPGKLLPKLVIRPFAGKDTFWLDNCTFVFPWPSAFFLVPAGFAILSIIGMMFMFSAFLTGAPWAYFTGFSLMLIGGSGLVLTWTLQRIDRFDVFDRINGVVRVSKRPKKGEKGHPWVLHEFPFQECDSRLTQKNHLMQASILYGLTIYHPSDKYSVCIL